MIDGVLNTAQGLKRFRAQGVFEIQCSFWVGAYCQKELLRVIDLNPLIPFSDILDLSYLKASDFTSEDYKNYDCRVRTKI